MSCSNQEMSKLCYEVGSRRKSCCEILVVLANLQYAPAVVVSGAIS